MTYVKQTWNNNDPATPVSAARLNYIEDGIEAAGSGLQGNIRVVEDFITDASRHDLAFMAAIADLPTSGGIVQAYGSSYTFGDTVFWDNKFIDIRGSGSGFMDGPVTGTRISISDITKPCFHIMNGVSPYAARSRMSGLHLMGAATTPGSAPGILAQCGHLHLTDIICQNFPGSGIEVRSIDRSTSMTALTATPVVGGGTFTAGTKYYRISAVEANGETVASPEATAVVVANGSVNLTWTAWAGATGYRIYRATTSNGTKYAKSLVAQVGAVTSYTDTGIATTYGNAAHTQASVNSNMFNFHQVRCYNNKTDGLRVAGSDSNVGAIFASEFLYNTGWGVYDSGILGNTYYSPHFAGNATGGFRVGSRGAKMRMYGGYIEDDNLPAVQFDSGTYANDLDWAQLQPTSGGASRIIDNSGSTNNKVSSYSGGALKSNIVKVGPDTTTESVLLNQDGILTLRGKSNFIYSADSTKVWVQTVNNAGQLTWQSASNGPLLLTNPVNASQGVTVKTVAGPVSDASFTVTPLDGTIAIDTTNSKIFVRIGGVWKSVTVA